MTTARASWSAGARAVGPLALAALPFGLVYGVAVAESGISPLVGIAGSWLVLAGAAQLSMLELIETGAPWFVIISTAAAINARFLLYSTAVAPAFGRFPARWRWLLPYLLTDQAAAVSLAHFDEEADPDARRWFVLGAGLTFATGWWIGTVVGAVTGGSLADRVDISFAVPAMFIALLIPTLVSRPALAAAVVGGVATVATSALPAGVPVLIGAACGVAAGVVVSTRTAS